LRGGLQETAQTLILLCQPPVVLLQRQTRTQQCKPIVSVPDQYPFLFRQALLG
jgi:hypothetical protein